jgi:GTPase SAR1 family protein
MSISIKKNKSPNLAKCEMVCDGGLHEKLNKYDVTQFLNGHETNLFLGKPRSGKTSLIYSFFKGPFKKVWHNIYLFQPTASRASMKDNIFESLSEDKKFNELNVDNLQQVMNSITNEDKKYNNCIIFDDMTAYLKDTETLKLLKELIFNRRHLRTSIFFLVQTWYSVPKDIRKLFSNCFIFRVNKEELKTIFNEIVEGKDDYINDISKLVYSEPYKYLFINTNSQRLFDGFNELIFDA